MEFRVRLAVNVLSLALLSSGCGKSSTAPLSGTMHGSAFNAVGSFTTHVDSDVVISLVNMQASCGAPATPADGEITVDIGIPNALLVPGTYSIGSDVTVGVTKTTNPAGGSISFDAVGLSSGSLVLTKVDNQITGSLTTSANGVSLDGTFSVALCQ